MTNPDNVGGLPSFVPAPKDFQGDELHRKFVAGWNGCRAELIDNLELCRAAPAGGDVEPESIAPGRPSDAGIASAFWQARCLIDSQAPHLNEPAVIRWGNDIVHRAREIDSPRVTCQDCNGIANWPDDSYCAGCEGDGKVDAAPAGGDDVYGWVLTGPEGSMFCPETHRHVMEASLKVDGCSAVAVYTRQQVSAPAGSGEVELGGWLWGKLMDFCKVRRFHPAEFNDLFAIVSELRALLRKLQQGADGWRPIESAPERVRVLVCGGDTPSGVTIATNDPDRYTPYHESHHRLPRIQAWYSDTTRGSGKIWPAPTHWRPMPRRAASQDQEGG